MDGAVAVSKGFWKRRGYRLAEHDQGRRPDPPDPERFEKALSRVAPFEHDHRSEIVEKADAVVCTGGPPRGGQSPGSVEGGCKATTPGGGALVVWTKHLEEVYEATARLFVLAHQLQ